MQNNPFKVPGATFGWVTATFRALDVCFDPQMLADYSVPTLVLGSPDDSVVDATAFKRWVQVASAHAKSEVRLRTFPGAKHELLSEIPEYYEPAVAEVRAALKPFLG
jgi:alpha-beta hydrolase superfamily lysophospholipase